MKRHFHVTHKEDLTETDKSKKLDHFIHEVSGTVLQFGVFREHLYVHDKMIPYNGRHFWTQRIGANL